MNRRPNGTTYARLRAIFGVLFIVLGALIVVQLVHGVGLRFEALPGILLGGAMIALGYIRIRAALAVGKTPP